MKRNICKPIINMNIENEIKTAEEYISLHPILNISPTDLRRENRIVDDYLKSWPEEERKVWMEYYEEEL